MDLQTSTATDFPSMSGAQQESSGIADSSYPSPSDAAMKADRELVLQTFASQLGASSGTQTEPTNQMRAPQSLNSGFLSVSSFGFGLMGMNSSMGSNNKSAELAECLERDPTTLCTIPSLDLFSGDMPDLCYLASGSWLAASPATAGSGEQPVQQSMGPPRQLIPEMTASVLSSLLPSSEQGNDSKASVVCEVMERNIQEKGAANLAEPISWTRSSCPQAPMTTVRSLSVSFSSLLDSRMKACILVLLRHSLNCGDDRSRSRLLALLSTSSTIGIKSIVTSFQSLSLPKEFQSRMAEEEGKVVLPLLFEACVAVMVREKQMDVKLRATGTIKGEGNVDKLLEIRIFWEPVR